MANWLTDARTLASPNIVILLVGNKKDLDADREVTFLEASRFAQENGKLINLRRCFDFCFFFKLIKSVCVMDVYTFTFQS